MKIPVQITLKDVPSSEWIRQQIEERAGKLDHVYDRIMSCRVVIDVPNRRRHQGKVYSVRIDLTVPGKELVVNKENGSSLETSIHDAFEAAERQLDEFADRRRGQ